MRRGAVRQKEKRSAGSAGLAGSCECASHAARMMMSSPMTGLPSPGCELPSILSIASIMRPALEQSSTRIHGVLSQHCRSYTESGMYCVNERLKTQISPLTVGRGTPCPLKCSSSRSSLPVWLRRSAMHAFLTSSSVGSRQSLYRARGCQHSYCACSAFAMTSSAFCDDSAGSEMPISTPAMRIVVPAGLTASGGSTPRLRHSTMPTATVFVRSWMRQAGTSFSGCGALPGSASTMARR